LASLEAAALAGLVAAAGWVFSLSRLLNGPDVEASEAEITSFFAEPGVGDDTALVLQVLFFATAGFLWFIGVVRKRLGRTEPRLFDTVFFGGGILLAASMFVGAAALAAPFVLADRGGSPVDPGAVAMTRGFALVILGTFLPRIAALFVFSSATLSLRTGVLPRWLAYLGYLVGIALIVDVTFSDPSIYALPAWVALVSVVLLFRRDAPDESASSTPEESPSSD